MAYAITVAAERLIPILQCTRHLDPAFLEEICRFIVNSSVRQMIGWCWEHVVLWNSLGSRYKLVGVVPISKQVSGLLVINTDVVVLEHSREEVINLPRYIQDVLNPEWEWDKTFHSILTKWLFWSYYITLCSLMSLQLALCFPPYPLFCNSSKLDAFHSDPCRKQKQSWD